MKDTKAQNYRLFKFIVKNGENREWCPYDQTNEDKYARKIDQKEHDKMKSKQNIQTME